MRGGRGVPPYVIPSGGKSTIASGGMPLGPAAYLAAGYLKVEFIAPANPDRVDCELWRVFLDSGGSTVGSDQLIASPSASIPGVGFVSIPLSGIAGTGSPPAAAVEAELRVQCETLVKNALANEVQLSLAAFDRYEQFDPAVTP